MQLTSLRRIKLWLLGPQDYPEAVVTLPEHLVADLPDLIARARAFNPGVATDSVIQAIWRLGSYRLGQNLLRRIPIKLAELPRPGQRVELPAPVAFRATDAWISVATFAVPRRLQARATSVPALWADLDPPPAGTTPHEEWRGAAPQRLRALPLTPTLIIDSGRGWQAYWVLVPPIDLSDDDDTIRQAQTSELVALNKCLQRELDGDSVGDLARVLRLPGSVNTKCGRMVYSCS